MRVRCGEGSAALQDASRDTWTCLTPPGPRARPSAAFATDVLMGDARQNGPRFVDRAATSPTRHRFGVSPASKICNLFYANETRCTAKICRFNSPREFQGRL